MKISDIYNQFPIPPNLQRHMYRAAAVGQTISSNWKGNAVIDEKTITTTLLLHDLANIIKFDLDNYAHLLEEESVNVAKWKQKQQVFIQSYGSDEHKAVLQIVAGLGMSERILYLLDHYGSGNLFNTVQLDDWDLKVSAYCDFRVDPNGIVSVNERFDEIISRYKGRSHSLGREIEVEKRRQFCLEIEKQIQPMTSTNLADIFDLTIKPYLTILKNYEV